MARVRHGGSRKRRLCRPTTSWRADKGQTELLRDSHKCNREGGGDGGGGGRNSGGRGIFRVDHLLRFGHGCAENLATFRFLHTVAKGSGVVSVKLLRTWRKGGTKYPAVHPHSRIPHLHHPAQAWFHTARLERPPSRTVN